MRLSLTCTPDLSPRPSIHCPPPQAFSLPPNPSKAAIKKRMGSNPALWRGARPLAGDLLDYAVGDVRALLQLADELHFQLGDAGEEVVERLSQAHAGGRLQGRWVGGSGERACRLCLSLPQQRDVQAAAATLHTRRASVQLPARLPVAISQNGTLQRATVDTPPAVHAHMPLPPSCRWAWTCS